MPFITHCRNTPGIVDINDVSGLDSTPVFSVNGYHYNDFLIVTDNG
jgi:hypothetical protein